MAEVLCGCADTVRRFTGECQRDLSIARIDASTRNHQPRKPRPSAQLLASLAAAVIQVRKGRLRRPMAQRLQSPTPEASANGERRRTDGAIDRPLERCIPFFHDDAWKAADDDFDLTDLIAAPFRPVRIREANRNPLDRCRELAELHPELSADPLAIVIFDLSSKHADVCRRQHRMGPVARELHRAGQ